MTRNTTAPGAIPKLVTFPGRTALKIPDYLTFRMKQLFTEIEAEMVNAGVKLAAFDSDLIAVFAGFLAGVESDWQKLKSGEGSFSGMASNLLEVDQYAKMLTIDKEALGRLMKGWAD